MLDSTHSVEEEILQNFQRMGLKGDPSIISFPVTSPNKTISAKNYFAFRFDHEVDYFADIIKIAITLITTTSQNSKKVKRITIYVLKFFFFFYFPK